MFDDFMSNEPELVDCLVDVYLLKKELKQINDEDLISSIINFEHSYDFELPEDISDIIDDYFTDNFSKIKRLKLDNFYVLAKINIMFTDNGEIYLRFPT